MSNDEFEKKINKQPQKKAELNRVWVMRHGLPRRKEIIKK
jgi:hypothetical protein